MQRARSITTWMVSREPRICPLAPVSLGVPKSPFHFMTCFLPVAVKTMNKVASHINEMQKIHEEFGAVFDQLIAEQTGEKKEVRTPFVSERLSVKLNSTG